MATGSGTIHEITSPIGAGNAPALALPGRWPNCAITLTDYQKYVAYDECAFWGVTYDGQEEVGCNMLWTTPQRDQLANALAEAQELFEGECGYPLCPKWLTEDQGVFCNPLMTSVGYLLAMGERVTSLVAAGENVAYVSEPAKIGPLATSVTDASELHFYIQGTDREVYPSSVILAGGFLTAEFPRARLVLPSYDTMQGWVGNRFTDMIHFAPELDIWREYTDATNAVTLLDRAQNCTSTSRALCARIENARLGIIQVNYCRGGACSWPYGVRLAYRAGLTILDVRIQAAVIRLAHTLIPESLCNQCDQIHRLWEADNKIPEGASRERLNCPFGLSDGAWFAYKRAQQVRNLRMRMNL